MAESFDAYHQWLGIAPKDQPPNHYQLLGIDLYESNANVIDNAADRQTAHLRTFQTGARSKLCQELLNQVSTARVLLLDAQKKAAYDEQMRTKLAQRAEPQPRVAAAIPLSQPAAHLAAAPKPGGTVPSQATASAAQFGGVSSRRRTRRKQNSPWLAVGIGGAVLGVVVVIAALATMGGGKGDARANAEPAVRPPKGNSADPTKKPAATAVAKPSGNGERKPTGDPLSEKGPEKKPDEDDPVKKEPVEKDPPKESPVDSDNPFEIIDDKDPPADDAPRPAVTKRPAKPAIPSAAAREKAGAEIRKIFDIDAVSDVAAKAKLARELLAAALDTADDPASQYVMLRMVRDTAATHGDYASAERAIGEMSQRFDVDVIAMRSAAVVQALAAKKIPPGYRKRIVRDALRVVRECHQADRYKHAKKSIAAALKAATSLRDKPLLADTRRLRDDGKVLAKQYEAVRGAFETLTTKPQDPAANTAAGKYLCYVKGDWKRGLAMLAQGNDALLKDLATREQRGVTKLNEQIALAEAWWKIADEQPSRTGGQLRSHAAHWYRMALPKLTGLDKLRVQKRLDEVRLKSRLAERKKTAISWISKDATYTVSSDFENFRALRSLLDDSDEMFIGPGGGPPSRIVPDGRFAFHTKTEPGAYITVDLGRVADVTGLYIKNRTGNNEIIQRARGLTVWLSTERGIRGTQVWLAKEAMREWTIPLNTPILARFVTIGYPNHKSMCLHLAKVKIYGK